MICSGQATGIFSLFSATTTLVATKGAFERASVQGLWHYAHGRKLTLGTFPVYGFACIPPAPFLLKDWERYDVSLYVTPGCVSPEQGRRSVPAEESEVKWATIQKDLAVLASEDPLERAVFLFHAPPCDTPLDRAAAGRLMNTWRWMSM